jgi:hypothetical protein
MFNTSPVISRDNLPINHITFCHLAFQFIVPLPFGKGQPIVSYKFNLRLSCFVIEPWFGAANTTGVRKKMHFKNTRNKIQSKIVLKKKKENVPEPRTQALSSSPQ